MMSEQRTILIATRGSALALAQANTVLEQCRRAVSNLQFDLRIIKTTGDKLQTASLAQEGKSLPKGLFTKELEIALLEHTADMAVHSLKDLPTELPDGLKIGAVGKRADVRDALIYRAVDSKRPKHRGFEPGIALKDLPAGAQVATSSPRRKAQLLVHNSTLKLPDLRGNVPTRLQKLAESPDLDATVLAMAGLARLGLAMNAEGRLQGEGIPEGLLVTILEPEVMLPCVGQGALGIEVRDADEPLSTICKRLNHFDTQQCVTAERALLAAMGGGCQSPVAAYAEVLDGRLRMRAVSFADGPPRHAEATRSIEEAVELGQLLAANLRFQ